MNHSIGYMFFSLTLLLGQNYPSVLIIPQQGLSHIRYS